MVTMSASHDGPVTLRVCRLCRGWGGHTGDRSAAAQALLGERVWDAPLSGARVLGVPV
jgi:hypothetical protein